MKTSRQTATPKSRMAAVIAASTCLLALLAQPAAVAAASPPDPVPAVDQQGDVNDQAGDVDNGAQGDVNDQAGPQTAVPSWFASLTSRWFPSAWVTMSANNAAAELASVVEADSVKTPSRSHVTAKSSARVHVTVKTHGRAHGAANDAQPSGDDGQQGNKDEGQQGHKDDGAQGDNNDQNGSTDDGQQGDTNGQQGKG